MTHQGTARDAASAYFHPSITKTDILVFGGNFLRVKFVLVCIWLLNVIRNSRAWY